MKKYLILLALPSLCFAQDIFAELTTEDFLNQLLDSLGGMKGASALAMAGVIVQLLIKFLKTPLAGKIFHNLSGHWKLTLVSGLSVVSGVLSLVLSGVPVGAALVHSATLSAFMVFFNQIYQQFVKPEDPTLK